MTACFIILLITFLSVFIFICADFLQSYYSAVLLRLQQDTRSSWHLIRNMNVNLQILFLKYLRLTCLHQAYPTKNSVEFAVIEDFIIHLKGVLELVATTAGARSSSSSSPADTCSYGGISLWHSIRVAGPRVPQDGHDGGGKDEMMSGVILSCCRCIFSDSKSGDLDYSLLLSSGAPAGQICRDGPPRPTRRGGPGERLTVAETLESAAAGVIPVSVVMALMLDNIYNIMSVQ
jgi:hypothetical protein